MEQNELIVFATLSGANYQTTLSTRTHNIVADEPLEDGGLDLGPKPTELLAMSLASCTAITLSMYAQRKSWNTGEIKVSVRRIIGENQTTFQTTFSCENELDLQIKERLLIIAKKCPVHKILLQPIVMETQFA